MPATTKKPVKARSVPTRRAKPVVAAPVPPPLAIPDDRTYVKEMVERLVRECPRRQPTSDDERKSQELMVGEFERQGLKTSWHNFKFNDNLYANIALHFGLGSLGTLVSGVAPLAGLALHGLAAGSYWADSTRKAYVLRRVLGFKASQNLLAVLPARGEPKLRIVIDSHADAAFTGLIFDPKVIKRFTAGKPSKLGDLLKRGLATATQTQAMLMGFDLLRVFLGPLTWPLRPIEFVLNVPALLTTVLNLEIVLRNTIVPGANDNLSAVVALPILAQRLARNKHPDVEYVFVVTGCEEASLGGGDALARDMEGVWDKTRTVFLGLDSLANGDLHFLEIEGEVVQTPIPDWLGRVVREAAASEPRFAEVKGFEVPVGGSNVAAYLARGWEGVCLTCLDPKVGSPAHYHQVTDTPENLDVDKVVFSIDFAEKVALGIVEHRLGTL